MSFWLGAIVSVTLFTVAGLAAGWLEVRLRLLSVAHGALMGTGAYFFALASKSGLATWLAFLLASLGGAAFGMVLVGISRRVVREDFALFSFAVQVAWFGLVANARPWTGGVLGVPGVDELPLVERLNQTQGAFVWALALLLLFGAVLSMERRGSFPVAAAIVARSGELADSLGLSSRWIRLQIGGFYGVMLGAVGAVLGSFLTFIGPEVFAVSVSVVVIAIGFLASWRWWGAMLGAVVLLGLPEALRAAGLASTSTAFFRQLLAGVIVALSAFVIVAKRRR